MKKTMLLQATALRSAALGVLAFASAIPAYAQETQAEEAQDPPETLTSEPETESGQDATTSDAIVVTGSRIRRPNLESVVPITSNGGEEYFQTGRTSVGDEINELTQAASTFSQSNSTRFLGTGARQERAIRHDPVATDGSRRGNAALHHFAGRPAAHLKR